jgi:hypothetical protein
MAISRPVQGLTLPEDFGIGLTVAGAITGLVILLCAAVAAAPSEGPRGQARQPEAGTYVDVLPARVPTLSTGQ